MHFRIYWLSLLILFQSLGFAQRFNTLSPEVRVGNRTVLYPWTGGFNTPQILNVDFNQDEKQDVIVFDRSGGVWMPFIWDGSLIYSPKDKFRFPKIKEWASMKDYNGDGHADIFAYSSTPGLAGIEVYDAVGGTTGLSFVKHIFQGDRANILFYTSGTSRLNAYVSSIDYPAIEDIDRDGDVDILSYEPGGSQIIWYKNLQADKKLPRQSFDLVIGDFCFGKILEDGLSEKITLSKTKDKCASGLASGIEVRHAGSTLLAFDRDGDRDYDLMVGDISSSGLIYLRNGGDTLMAYMDDQEIKFPTNSVAVDLPYFVTPFVADVNNDGIKEFFAGSNFQFGSDNFHCLWRYDRVPSNPQNYKYNTNVFLVDQTIDFGENTYPTLADVTGDGLLDIVVGTGGFFDRSGIHDASIVLFKNIGTGRKPAFQLIDSNWLDFKRFNGETNSFAPAFGDMDGDGDLDLVVGELLGHLYGVENIGGKNKPMTFGPIRTEYSKIDIGQYAAPQLEDLDLDGLIDLIVGERDGVINFFKNTGTVNAPLFSSSPTIGNLGAIDTRVTGFATGNATPFFIKSQKNRLLAVGTSGKDLLLYDQPSASAIAFKLSAENWGAIHEGDESHPAIADIDQDGSLDVLVGNQRGGLAWYQTDLPSDFSTLVKVEYSRLNLRIFPNPSSDYCLISTAGIIPRGELRVYDLSGKLMSTQPFSGKSQSVDLTALASGVYHLILSTVHKKYHQKLIVQH